MSDDNIERLQAHLVAEALADNDTRLNVGKMTVEEFRALPMRASWNSEEEPFDSIVILPAPDGAETHDSGFRTIDVIGCRGVFPVCRLAGAADHLWQTDKTERGRFDPRWNIDCLPTSGLLRMWCNDYQIKVGSALSTFDITFVAKPPFNPLP